MTAFIPQQPDTTVSGRIFGLEASLKIPAFSQRSELVPMVDVNYVFDQPTTRAIIAGFMHNRRVLINGMHGTGKSTHIEQVAARLNWPCMRLNLDSHISRIDLMGRDAIIRRDNHTLTEFQLGLLPRAVTSATALVLDEYDAGRPDVMFVVQRLLESEGRLTILENNQVLLPHPSFRLFATANTVGQGDATGIYHGTQMINQGQMDRWHMVVALNYLAPEHEIAIVTQKLNHYQSSAGQKLVMQMVTLANLIREAFRGGQLTTIMSPRTVLNWAENHIIYDNVAASFCLSYLNKCDPAEKTLVAELYQRVFATELII